MSYTFSCMVYKEETDHNVCPQCCKYGRWGKGGLIIVLDCGGKYIIYEWVLGRLVQYISTNC